MLPSAGNKNDNDQPDRYPYMGPTPFFAAALADQDINIES